MRLLFAILLIAAGAASAADLIVGPARVVDGDTLAIGDERIRIIGIDAPERGHPAGPRATAALRELVGDRDVACEVRGRDRWGRALAVCRAGGIDVAREMVRQGWALAWYPAGGIQGPSYDGAETEARQRDAGVWGDGFAPPDSWRR